MGKLNEAEQRDLVKSCLTKWDVRHDVTALSALQDQASKAGINFKVTSNLQDIADYVNDKGGINDPRSAKPLTNLTYVGHGLPGGKWAIDYSDVTARKGIDVNQIISDAFTKDAIINFNASCNGATADATGDSVVNKFQRKVGSNGIISGTLGATDFGKRPVDTDEELLDRNRSEPFFDRLFAEPRMSIRTVVHGTDQRP